MDSIYLYKKFVKLIKVSNTNEREILNFIKDTESYFILDSLFDFYNFGHHDAYLFREIPLSNKYVCDFLLIDKNSNGYVFIFIEFEHLNSKSILSNGEFGKSIRSGLNQLKDWEQWKEANFHLLRDEFAMYQKEGTSLLSEFYVLDKTRLHFLVIAGKRKDYNDSAYKLNRESG